MTFTTQPITDTDPATPTAIASHPSPGWTVLPRAPQTASPVPTLTSLHLTPGRGPYGRDDFAGNGSGHLIRDLLNYYQPRRVLDPLAGSDTCGDVCRELEIPWCSFDLSTGRDGTAASAFWEDGLFDFVWLHPPSWNSVRWSNDPRCLANAPTLREFLRRLRAIVRNAASVLRPGGHLALCIGDLQRQGEYLALPTRALNIAYAEGLVLAAPEIIRVRHDLLAATEKQYPQSFIPRMHDVCWVLKCRPQPSPRN